MHATTLPSSSPVRRLGHPQLSFVRCWAEGLDLVAAWNRYLYVDGAGDSRRARSELRRLLDQLRSLARAQGRPDLAALLRRDPEAILDRDRSQPTLEQFAEQQPPDFYSEAELLALYQEQVGPVDSRSAARRRQRLRERLVLALQWLGRETERNPQPTDTVGTWLDERLARRLAASGISTLGDLQQRIGAKGFHWHHGIPRVGPAGAARVVRWLRDHAGSLGELPRRALSPPGRAGTPAPDLVPRLGIVPLERLLLPVQPGGTLDRNRDGPAASEPGACDDLEAVRAWLAQRTPESHTWRAYRREAERFLLWTVLARRKALSHLDSDDCAAYQAFLRSPDAEWTSPRRTQRGSEAWRPFEGPLSERSQDTAVAILRSLCDWLVERGHLRTNPWRGFGRPTGQASVQPLRAFSGREWSQMLAWQESRPTSAAGQRLGFILRLACTTGMRLTELVEAQVGWLHAGIASETEPTWVVRVPGMRRPWRQVPLPGPTMASMQAYFTARGLDPSPLVNPPQTPLIARLSMNAPLSAARLYEVLVAAFERCAADLQRRDPQSADRIRQASTHWLRHTYAADAANRGMAPPVLQSSLGHARRASTATYLRGRPLHPGFPPPPKNRTDHG